jgi:hypothetical protein
MVRTLTEEETKMKCGVKGSWTEEWKSEIQASKYRPIVTEDQMEAKFDFCLKLDATDKTRRVYGFQ